MAETSTIFGFMKYVSATDILSDFKKTVDSHFVNSLRRDQFPSLSFGRVYTLGCAFESSNIFKATLDPNTICEVPMTLSKIISSLNGNSVVMTQAGS